MISGIIFVIRNGLRWRDAPREYGPHKTLYNRFVRWSRLGVFDRIFAELAVRAAPRSGHDRCDPSEGPSHRGQPAKKGAVPRRIGRTKGGLNSKLHAVCDGQGTAHMLLSEGQMSDYNGAALISCAAARKPLLADKGYDADWFRQALAERDITACIPSKANRAKPIQHDRALSATPQNRKHVRQAQGLAAHPHPIRPMRPHLLLCHLHRSQPSSSGSINES